jgi:hypothetical protein
MQELYFRGIIIHGNVKPLTPETEVRSNEKKQYMVILQCNTFFSEALGRGNVTIESRKYRPMLIKKQPLKHFMVT